ncbi:MAG: lipid-A-disaccharide synthase [Methylophilaceae bacterium]|nr:lipid-A-disaccharide synthase [Methylophilaceae bacterium]
MTKIALVAGEPSGDLIASQLMLEINKKFKNIEYVGIGGPMMHKNGLISFFDYKILGIHGYIDAIKNIFKLLILRRNLIKYLLDQKPDIYIGIDAPDFNFYIEKTLKKNKVMVFHYVSPSVWAWRKNRIYSMKSYMNHLFLVFPHEIKIFKSIKLPSTYVGHPLAKIIPLKPNSLLSKKKVGVPETSFIISILPGSRSSEVKSHLDIMLSSAMIIQNKMKNVLFLIPCNNKENFEKINNSIFRHNALNIRTIIGHSHDVINASDFVIVASGTATLETALYKKPMLIIYKTSWWSWQILRRMKLIPWIGLPNILLNKLISPELVQKRVNSEEIANEALKIINNKKYKASIIKEFIELHKSLRRNTSTLILDVLKKYI